MMPAPLPKADAGRSLLTAEKEPVRRYKLQFDVRDAVTQAPLPGDVLESIILDNSPASYIFHPNNAVPVSSWFNDPHDAELTDLVPFLADLTAVDDVRGILSFDR